MGEEIKNNYHIKEIRHYFLTFPTFRKPEEIGTFSLNNLRQFQTDTQNLKLYNGPLDLFEKKKLNVSSLNFDLNVGFDSFIDKINKDENLDNLLKWISLNKIKFLIKDQNYTGLNTDFVCWRGLLTKLANTPYENKEGWKFVAQKYQSTIFLNNIDTKAKIEWEKNKSQNLKKICYGGMKFEHYLTSLYTKQQVNFNDLINLNEEFISVVRSRLDSHSLVYGGEIDCCKPDFLQNNIAHSNNMDISSINNLETNDKLSDTTPKEITEAEKLLKNKTNKYLELKTSTLPLNKHQMYNFRRYKLIKWWLQSFLIGIQQIICGFRNSNGIVQELQLIEVNDVPKNSKVSDWEATVCFNFLNQFLLHLKQAVQLSGDRCVYIFELSPGKSVVSCQIIDSPSSFQFIPEWYKSEMQP